MPKAEPLPWASEAESLEPSAGENSEPVEGALVEAGP